VCTRRTIQRCFFDQPPAKRRPRLLKNSGGSFVFEWGSAIRNRLSCNIECFIETTSAYLSGRSAFFTGDYSLVFPHSAARPRQKCTSCRLHDFLTGYAIDRRSNADIVDDRKLCGLQYCLIFLVELVAGLKVEIFARLFAPFDLALAALVSHCRRAERQQSRSETPWLTADPCFRLAFASRVTR
jgi:hypothetical protein